MSTVVTPNQSYLLKQMQTYMAAALAVFMRDLGGNITDAARPDNAWSKDPLKIINTPHAWGVGYEKFWPRMLHNGYTYNHGHTSEAGSLASDTILFRNPRWDTENSDLKYGTKTINQNINERDTGKTKIIRNDTDDEVHVAYEESVDITNSFSSSITKGVTLDVTKDASVDTSLTIKGEAMGVGAEASVAAHMGVSQTKSSSTELGKEQSEEGTKSESLSIEFDAKARTYYLVEVTREAEDTNQPYDIDGVMDTDGEMHFNNVEFKPGFSPAGHIRSLFDHHHYPYRPGSVISFTGIDGLLQLVHGYDTRHGYDRLEGYWDATYPNVRAAIEWLANPENRRIQVSGISHASLQSNADYDVQELGSHIPDALAHLPVEDADNVNE